LPSRALGAAGGAGLELLVDGVADLPLEGAQRFFAGLALGDLLVVVGAAVAVLVADLGDGGHVDGVVQAPVPAHRQAVDDPVAGGHLDRRGAVIGSETVPAAEPGHLADVAGHRSGDDRADPEDLGQGRA
jgi:hypothetical protein